MEATIKSRLEFMEQKNQELQRKLHESEQRNLKVEAEYHDALKSLSIAKTDTKISPKGVVIFV